VIHEPVFVINRHFFATPYRIADGGGALVADVTWGEGAFWRKLNGSRRVTLTGSDIREVINVNGSVRQVARDVCADFRQPVEPSKPCVCLVSHKTQHSPHVDTARKST